MKDDRHIKCLIIYPDMNADAAAKVHLDPPSLEEIVPYYEVYKLGIGLPVIDLLKTDDAVQA